MQYKRSEVEKEKMLPYFEKERFYTWVSEQVHHNIHPHGHGHDNHSHGDHKDAHGHDSKVCKYFH